MRRNLPACLLGLALLAAVVAAAHGPALAGGFLAFDDDRIVTANPLFRAPAGEALAGILDPTRTIADAYLPVAHLVLWGQWRLFGAWPAGFHAVSLLLHAGAALALVLLGRRLGLPAPAAWGGALLWAAHPALVEAVAWVSGQKVLLAGLLSFLSLRLWVEGLAGRPRRAWLALPLALLAAYAHGAALALLPWAFLVAGLVARRRQGIWAPLAGLALLGAAAAGHHLWLAAREGPLAAGGPARSLLLPAGTFSWYLRRALWPAGASVDYPFAVYQDSLAAGGIAAWGPALALALLAAGLVLTARRRRLLPALAAGPGLFLLGLAPFNNLLPASSVLLADRYLYLPLSGLALAGGALLLARWPGKALAGLVLLAAAGTAHQRSRDFRDDLTLWRATLRAEPGSAVGAFNLAKALFAAAAPGTLKGRRGEEVAALLDRALASDPRPALRARVLREQAALAARRGEPAPAAEYLARAARELATLPAGGARDQELGRTLLERARRLDEAAQPEEADRVLAELARLLPEWEEGRVGSAGFAVSRIERLQRGGRTAEAEAEVRGLRPLLEELVRRHPTEFGAFHALARLQATQLAGGTYLRAMELLYRAREIAPDRVETYVEAANLYQRLEPPDVAGALAELELGLRRRPGDPDLLARKGLVLLARGDLEQAAAWLLAARKAAPDRADLEAALIQALVVGLEETLKDKGRRDPSLWLERLQKVDRTHPETLRGMGLVLAAADRLDDAVPLLEEAMARGAAPARIAGELAEALKRRGYQLLGTLRERALECFHRALELAPPSVPMAAVVEILDAEIHKLLASARLLRASEPIRAQAVLRRAWSLLPPSGFEAVALILEREEIALSPGQEEEDLLAEARTLLRDRLGGPPGPKEVAVLLERLLERNESSQASWLGELAAWVLPADPALAVARARVHQIRGEFGVAREILGEGVRLWPGNERVRGELGQILCLEGLALWRKEPGPAALARIAEGASLAGPARLPEEADDLLRREARAALEEADQSRERGRFGEARRLYDQGASLLPPGVSAEVGLRARSLAALCRWREGDPEGALPALAAVDEAARSQKVPLAMAALGRAELLHSLGRGEEAARILTSWLLAFPSAEDRGDVENLLRRLSPASRPAGGGSARPCEGETALLTSGLPGMGGPGAFCHKVSRLRRIPLPRAGWEDLPSGQIGRGTYG